MSISVQPQGHMKHQCRVWKQVTLITDLNERKCILSHFVLWIIKPSGLAGGLKSCVCVCVCVCVCHLWYTWVPSSLHLLSLSPPPLWPSLYLSVCVPSWWDEYACYWNEGGGGGVISALFAVAEHTRDLLPWWRAFYMPTDPSSELTCVSEKQTTWVKVDLRMNNHGGIVFVLGRLVWAVALHRSLRHTVTKWQKIGRKKKGKRKRLGLQFQRADALIRPDRPSSSLPASSLKPQVHFQPTRYGCSFHSRRHRRRDDAWIWALWCSSPEDEGELWTLSDRDR